MELNTETEMFLDLFFNKEKKLNQLLPCLSDKAL